MKNITVSIADDVYRSARIRAAERGASVSSLVGDYLRSLSDQGTEFARLEQQQRQVQDEITILYAVSRDAQERDKAEHANQILAAGDLALSVQVLQEFHVQETTTALMRAAAATRDPFRISYWDVAILEAGRSMGCELVLSEDLSDGADYGGVRVENPFRGL